MDQTSSTAAIVVPIAAALGLVGMVTTINLALRGAKDTICPQRAQREAAAARLAADPITSLDGGAAVIGAQRGPVREPVA